MIFKSKIRGSFHAAFRSMKNNDTVQLWKGASTGITKLYAIQIICLCTETGANVLRYLNWMHIYKYCLKSNIDYHLEASGFMKHNSIHNSP